MVTYLFNDTKFTLLNITRLRTILFEVFYNKGGVCMEIETITTLISTVGFPIFCTIMLFKQNGEISKSVQSNTSVIERLKESIDDLKERLHHDA